ncbi:hypothetical protein COW81_03165 [Candidatus Campbellbacteria bacterium CG22_combo_CG10-13_8_21_14_all_36_13]|uniref:Uncharacterized protein n=1 Tax=Candidatus Campbellbacteria bacterium CG22_combo_CG10-13_8_21_14_all_36_13 TaxID=1974529 RepID=A0A2H0DY32_9BACT|nr:MAG: hypothetical protein COW81_03165 [Candidatus Campbellbacteria bacterium CG22_combo_CG10-13_8_21_14_all_36_13]
MERTFSIQHEFQGDEENNNERQHAVRFLEVLNGLRKKVLAPDMHPQGLLHKAVHVEKLIDSRGELESLEAVRDDILYTFGVPNDKDHVFIAERDGNSDVGTKKQRAVRAFYVLVDLLSETGDGTAYYAEGRDMHAHLFNTIVERFNVGADIDELYELITADNPRFLTFKGFLSGENFADLPDTARATLEEKLTDSNGEVIETPPDWFITGTSL